MLLTLARKYVKNRRLKKLIKFGIVGATAFGASYFTYICLCEVYFLFHPNLDALFMGTLPFYILFSVIGDLTGMAVGYPINKKWTFRQQVNHERSYFAGYFFVYLFSFLLNQFLLYALVEWCRGMAVISDPYISKIIATMFSASSNFIGTNFLVFRKSHLREPDL
jgi:putative flippase GtrA